MHEVLELFLVQNFGMIEPNGDHFIVQNRELLHNSMIKSTGYVTNLPYGAVGIYEIHVSSS